MSGGDATQPRRQLGITHALTAWAGGPDAARRQVEYEEMMAAQRVALAEREHQLDMEQLDAEHAATLATIASRTEALAQRQTFRTRRDMARTQSAVWKARQQAAIALAIFVLSVLGALVLSGLAIITWGQVL